MCTALSFKSPFGTFFGRNMDLAWNFNQTPIFIPRNAKYLDRVCMEFISPGRAILGMGTLIDGHPSMAEAMNEDGLACAGLNFARYAVWANTPLKDKHNLAPYDFILWVLANHKNVSELKAEISKIEFVDVPINENVPCPTLHWMISDSKGESIVVEKTVEGIKVHSNPVHVMTNDPCFDWHLTNLREYLKLSPMHPKNTSWSDEPLSALGLGAGTLGMPGDFASVSRFVRSAFACSHIPEFENYDEAVSHCFNMLSYAAMVKGCVKTPEDKDDLTLYSSCMDQTNCLYYYKTCSNSRINAISMKNEDMNGNEIKCFPYHNRQDIKYCN